MSNAPTGGTDQTAALHFAAPYCDAAQRRMHMGVTVSDIRCSSSSVEGQFLEENADE